MPSCALFGNFPGFSSRVRYKTVQRLFVDERLAVFLNADAVIDFIGEDFGSVLFEVRFDEFLRFVFCF